MNSTPIVQRTVRVAKRHLDQASSRFCFSSAVLRLWSIRLLGASLFAATLVPGDASAAPTLQAERAPYDGSAATQHVMDVSPLGLQQGDLLVVVFGMANAATVSPTATAPTGFTLIEGESQPSSGGKCGLWAWYHEVGATPPSSVTIDLSHSRRAAACAYRITGHDSTAPINVSAINSGTSGTVTGPSVTTTVSDCLVLTAVSRVACDNFDTGDYPSGWSAGHVEYTVDNGTTNEAQMTNAAAHKTLSSAGSSGAPAWLCGQRRWIGVTFAVAPGGSAPAAPSSLSATAASSSGINLAWTDNSSDETGFKVERKTGAGGTYGQIDTTGANATTYGDTGLAASTEYYYQVRATNASGDSAYSNEDSATTDDETYDGLVARFAPNVVSYWKFQNNGTDEQGTQNATITGSPEINVPTIVDLDTFAEGAAADGEVIAWSGGTGEYAEAAHNAAHKTAAGTIVVTFQLDSLSEKSTLVAADSDSAAGGLSVEVTTDGSARAFLKNASGSAVILMGQAGDVQLDQAYTQIFKWGTGGLSLALYDDTGALLRRVTDTLTDGVTGTSTIRFGAWHTDVSHHDGPYGRVIWLDRRISDAEEADLARAKTITRGGDTEAPTASVTAPTAGASVAGTIPVTADASDNVGVVGVQFKLDGVNLGAEDTTSPYSVNWDTTTASNGAHSLTAVARDAAENSTTSTAVNVTVDNSAPTVSVTAPTEGASVKDSISVAADASDNEAVVGVQFKLDGVDLGAEDTTSPYSINWDTTTASDGSHSLTAVARDAAGNSTTSTAVGVTVDNAAPTVSVTSPEDQATVSGSISVTANASDNEGVIGVQFKLDGANLGAEDTTSPYSVNWDTTTAADGAHALTAVARDAAGSSTTSTAVNVTVDNSGGGTTTYDDWVAGFAPNVVSYWKLQNTGADEQGTQNATITGSPELNVPTIVDLDTLAEGASADGEVIAWSGGTGQYAEAAHNAAHKTAEGTIVVTFQRDSDTEKSVLVAADSNSAAGGLSVEVNTDGSSRAFLKNASGSAVVLTGVPGDVQLNQAYTQIFKWGTGGLSLALYDDTGTLVRRVTDPLTDGAAGTSTIRFGAWHTDVSHHDGPFGRVIWLDRRITDTEEADLARARTITHGGGGSPPAAPSGLGATAVSSSQIDLSWTDNSGDETGFKIERKTGAGGTYAEIHTTAADATGYSDSTGLLAGTTYFYRVRATNAFGDSAYSNEDSATTQSGGGTIIDLGNHDDYQQTTLLNAGGDAQYDATGITGYLEWLGPKVCSGGLDRSDTSEQFLFRWGDNVQNGGRIWGGRIYSHLTVHDDYDNMWPNGAALYPCSDGGQIFVRDREIRNFTIESFRIHGGWDPIRLGGSSHVIENITIKDVWATCVRDDFVENDSMREGLVIKDCLIGDTITASTNGNIHGGCFVFLSQRNKSSTDFSSRVTEVRNCLVWSTLVKASDRANDINGYVVQKPFKISGNSPRFDIFDTVFMVDHRTIGGDGDPFNALNAGGKLRNSSGNIVIWRDLGGMGTYPWPLPPGFTLMEGQEGEDYWNAKVAEWKANHPNVPRLNKPGLIVDQN